MKSSEKDQKVESGSVMTEAAIAIPVLLLLVMGIIQFGFAFSALVALKNASAIAARHAVLDGASNADVEQAARDAIAQTLDLAHLTAVNITTPTVNGAAATKNRV